METGKGKTFVSIMLINYIMSKHQKNPIEKRLTKNEKETSKATGIKVIFLV